MKSHFSRYDYAIIKIIKIVKKLHDFIIWQIRVFFRKKRNKFDFDRIYWISPDKINYCTVKEFNPFKYDGVVLNGEWDRLEKRFDELDVFIAFKEHFHAKVAWQDTQFYKNIISQINRKQFSWGCRSEKDFIKRCEKLDNLYFQIKKSGYKTQRCLQNGFLGVKSIDEISVNIGRKGDILFNNSAHRLSIAKLLKIEKIPIRVTVCHKNVRSPSYALKE